MSETSIVRLVDFPGASGVVTDFSRFVANREPSRLALHSNQNTWKSTDRRPTFETQNVTAGVIAPEFVRLPTVGAESSIHSLPEAVGRCASAQTKTSPMATTEASRNQILVRTRFKMPNYIIIIHSVQGRVHRSVQACTFVTRLPVMRLGRLICGSSSRIVAGKRH